MAIKGTQFGPELKSLPKFYGPYLIKTVKPHNRNEVEKVGQREGDCKGKQRAMTRTKEAAREEILEYRREDVENAKADADRHSSNNS
ncbi:hypothetical protein TNCV_1264951 [Trichonephila clavipes]|nr:hypothetical protein TNCV_1264951 [Trichonephila clavipes]